MEISFKKWINESRDLFGFEKIDNKVYQKVQDEYPINYINTENMMEELLRSPLNDTHPFSKFSNHIQWGRNNGATQVTISPLGSFRATIRRLQTNLEGNQVWICKKILPFKEVLHSNLRIDENLAHKIFSEIEECNENQLESAIGDYSNLENLMVQLVRECQKPSVMPKILIFLGVKEIKHNENYVIHFECKGHGLEAPTSARVEAFLIDMTYDPKTGIIRSTGYEVQSPTKGHKWTPQPSEWDEYFSPAQPNAEIIKCISGALYNYA